jgi:CspA family cold shock protein
MVSGTVRFWTTDKGWGVIDSSETSGGCWANFSFVEMEGYRSLSDGQAVELEWERPQHGDYEGYEFFATRVTPGEPSGVE